MPPPSSESETSRPPELLVVGSGVAGLTAAIRATQAGLRCVVITKGRVGQGSTRWAQGGVAAVLDDEDSAADHAADTLAAGGGLCDPEAVEVLVSDGGPRVRDLMELGAEFDRLADGSLSMAREGGHGRARIVHAGGAATGVEIERALVSAAHSLGVEILEGSFVADLLMVAGRCAGVRAVDSAGQAFDIRSDHTLLAAGGSGQLYAVTTNPVVGTGDGIAMAMRAGAAVSDLEFMQFHPTGLHHDAMPRPLLSEAMRGHGALLRDHEGNRFVDELAPRDVVARAITETMLSQEVDHVWLDATAMADVTERFPNIAARLAEIGLDPRSDLLPVAPAAHYHCGGVMTDLNGASTIPGLWAAGEVTTVGVHGANRLASNSLLDGLVFGHRAVAAILDGVDGPEASGVLRGVLEESSPPTIGVTSLVSAQPSFGRANHEAADPADARRALQEVMSRCAGVVRTESSLQEAMDAVVVLAAGCGQHTVADLELRNLCTVGLGLLVAARERRETRGAHTRGDHPQTDPTQRHRIVHQSSADSSRQESP